MIGMFQVVLGSISFWHIVRAIQYEIISVFILGPRAKATMEICLLLISDSLESQELFNAPMAIEAPESTRFGAAMRQRPFIVHSHGVDMDSTALDVSLFREI